VDPGLLSPIKHRSEGMQRARTLLRARAQLVEVRTQLVNSVRSLVKSYSGERLPSCSTASFHKKASAAMDEALRPMLTPMLVSLETITAQLGVLDGQIEYYNRVLVPETARLQQVGGVGAVTALAFVATLDDPKRFQSSRSAAAFLGLCPRRDPSGDVDKQLGITQCGDPYMRKLWVQCAHRIVGVLGPDSDLRRWGLALAERGGKNAKKRAIVAVARKLAVLLHALWSSGKDYVALGYRRQIQAAA
jgi:transposase